MGREGASYALVKMGALLQPWGGRRKRVAARKF
jgi:hypothetical protein